MTLRTILTAAVFAGASMTAAQAATITIKTEPGIAMETEFGIRPDTGTRGVDLAGAVATATFDDGTTETQTWFAFDPFNNGGVNGDRWSLFQQVDDNISIVSDGRIMTSLLLDLSSSQSVTQNAAGQTVTAGATLFDISAANENLGEPGSTPGSTFGFPFEFGFDAPMGAVIVTYSGVVNLKGSAALGDLYTTMYLDFSGLDAGGFTGDSVYRTDTDTLLVAGDLRVVQTAAVPLPAGLPLLLAGLGGLGLVRRAKRRA